MSSRWIADTSLCGVSPWRWHIFSHPLLRGVGHSFASSWSWSFIRFFELVIYPLRGVGHLSTSLWSWSFILESSSLRGESPLLVEFFLVEMIYISSFECDLLISLKCFPLCFLFNCTMSQRCNSCGLCSSRWRYPFSEPTMAVGPDFMLDLKE